MQRNTAKTHDGSSLRGATALSQRIGSGFLAALLAVTLAFVPAMPLGSAAGQAFAVTEETDAEPDEFQQRVEQTAADYDAAVERVGELQQQIASNQDEIQRIEQELPDQQQRASEAMREQYKMQREAPGLIEVILGAGTFSEFLTTFDYFAHVQDNNLAEISQLVQMRSDLESVEQALSQAMDEAQTQQAAAEQALADAQAAREEAQRRAQEEAERQAAEEAQRQTEEAAQQQAASAEESDAANGQESASQPEESEPVDAPSSDGADWSSDKDAFVAQWAGRIDAYLAGSPLAGQGATFASAAWDYGVDPRWSPAISNTESSKGLYCFLPHNAWGWGSSSWGSWEEAIYAHVAGLARGYGYTISVEAAKKYCPPNWQHWYNATLAQMNMI